VSAPGLDGYAPFAARLAAGGLVADPWLDGRPRFDPTPLDLARADYDALAEGAEAVAAVLDEMAAIVAAEPALLVGFFGLTETQRLMWGLSARRGTESRAPTCSSQPMDPAVASSTATPRAGRAMQSRSPRRWG
jgi:hypothetical protein